MNLCARTGLIAVYALGAPEKYDSQKRLGKGVERKKTRQSLPVGMPIRDLGETCCCCPLTNRCRLISGANRGSETVFATCPCILCRTGTVETA